MEEKAYILGTDQEELQRLGTQHQVWASEAQKGWESAGFRRGMHLLDLGCGPGFCTRELARIVGHEGKVIGVDMSKKYIDHVAHLATIEKLNIETINCDFDSLQLDNDSLDGMYCRWALAWIPNPEEILAKVHSALKPGGKIVLHEYFDWGTFQTEPIDEDILVVKDAIYQSYKDDKGDIDVGRRLAAICSQIGYKISSIRPMQKIGLPGDLVWNWPKGFLDVYLPKLVEQGYMSQVQLEKAMQAFDRIASQPGTILYCPSLIEVIAEKA